MKLKNTILEELDQEAKLTRRALEMVPEGKSDFKPHPKSMPMGQLVQMIAEMPSWIPMMVNQDELDIKPNNGGLHRPPPVKSTQELIAAHAKAEDDARKAVSDTSDEHLLTPWRLLEGGKVASEDSRYRFLMDHFGHVAHHRGQLTVYLRLLDAAVPAIYGPSADDHRF